MSEEERDDRGMSQADRDWDNLFLAELATQDIGEWMDANPCKCEAVCECEWNRS